MPDSASYLFISRIASKLKDGCKRVKLNTNSSLMDLTNQTEDEQAKDDIEVDVDLLPQAP